MIIKLNGVDYNLSTNLGVAYDIESTKRKKINEIISSDIDIKGMIDIIYFGFKKKNVGVSLKEFEDLVLNADEMSYINLQKEFSVFSNMLMSTEKTETEVRKMVEDIFTSKKQELEEELNNEKN